MSLIKTCFLRDDKLSSCASGPVVLEFFVYLDIKQIVYYSYDSAFCWMSQSLFVCYALGALWIYSRRVLVLHLFLSSISLLILFEKQRCPAQSFLRIT